MATFRDLLKQTKSEIREVDTAEADELRHAPGAVVLDVREPDEYEQGAIPGAIHIPRGQLESNIEGRVPDHDTPLIVICAAGIRSAFAAKTLAELGYTDVVSVAGGFNKWKDEGREWRAPRVLSPEQRNRYQRHLLLPEVGEEGQLKLLDAKVLLLGAGGLGSPAALYLAAAGVGTIGIIDMDVVDDSNLQRQILHNVDRIGERKVDSAKKTLTALNPDVNVVTHDVRLGADNVMSILEGYDIVVDGTDNFPTRYLVNDASVKLGIPVVHGSIFRFDGMVTVFDPRRGPTYRDMVPEPPSGRDGAVVRRGRRARRAARHHRLDPGPRGHQADPRPRRPADRPAAGLRLARAELPHLQGPRRSQPTRSRGRTGIASWWPSSTGCACRIPCRLRPPGGARPALDSADPLADPPLSPSRTRCPRGRCRSPSASSSTARPPTPSSASRRARSPPRPTARSARSTRCSTPSATASCSPSNRRSPEPARPGGPRPSVRDRSSGGR